MTYRTCTTRSLILTLAALGLSSAPVLAQNGRPVPDAPTVVEISNTTSDDRRVAPAPPPRAVDVPAVEIEADPITVPTVRRLGEPRADVNPSIYRREGNADEMVMLAFDNVSIDETIRWIVEVTGKVVIPVQLDTLKTHKITLMNDKPLPAMKALDLLFKAFRLNEIGVVELDDQILLANRSDALNLGLPVLAPEDDVMYRDDVGTMVIKIFKLVKREAESVAEQLEETLPDYGSLSYDASSNQIIVQSDIGTCRRLQLMINQLDNTYINVRTKTYRLRYADASEIAQNIEELFDDSGTTARSSGTSTQRRQGGRTSNRAGRSPSTAGSTPGPLAELKYTVNAQQNTVTVQADPDVVEEIERLIFEYWDLPRPEGTSKMYRLQYTDPLKVRDVLKELLEEGGSSTGRQTRGGGAAGGNRSSASQAVSGIYQVEAYTDTNSLLVLCKTEDSFKYLDSIITELDKPTTVGLPIVVELRYADAVEVANELNVLLSPAGSNMTLQAPDTGLSGQGLDGESSGASGAAGRETEQGGEIRFPWQSGRQAEDQSPETPLIGKTRIVPIRRLNALEILAPPQYQEYVREMIQYLDRPGRQVMVSCIIAEVELNDDFALGLRVSREAIPQTSLDNSVGLGVTSSNTQNPIFDGLFNTSSLTFDFNANAALQALDQRTNVRILQEPRLLTADGQEAVFFDGQDVPFVTDSFSNNSGGLTQGFEYRQVGVVLNVRPRITAERDVDLEVYLELSSIVPGQTLFGGAIVDRRSTTTEIVVKDKQTIVLSGILRDEESDIVRKFPGLGDLPLIGGLFQSTEKRNVTTELIAFITPEVISHPTENDYNYNAEDRQRLKLLRDHEISDNHDFIREGLRDRIMTLPPERDRNENLMDQLEDSGANAAPQARDQNPSVIPTVN